MTKCSMFEAAGFLRSVWTEIDNLTDAAAIARQGAGLNAEWKADDAHADYPEQRIAVQFSTTRAFKHQRSPALISLFFDLWRPPQASDWPHGDKSLLIVAYSRRYHDGWGCDLLATQATGQFEDLDTRRNTTPFLGNRLWVWGVDESPSEWARREWFYGVELNALTGPEALGRLVIDPLVGLLKSDDAEAALANIEAVVWPQQTQE